MFLSGVVRRMSMRCRRRLAASIAERAAQPCHLHALAHQAWRDCRQGRNGTQHKGHEQDQDQRGTPHGVKEKLQGSVRGIAQRQHEQQRKQDDADNPGDEFHAVWAGVAVRERAGASLEC